MSRKIPALLALWLVLAIVVGRSEILAAAPFPRIPLLLWSLVIVISAIVWRSPELRRWSLAVDLRALVAVHLTRFVGFYFLALYNAGRLPFAFAVPGGFGDIAVASLALLLIGLAPREGTRVGKLYLGWNLLGLADILFVVVTAARLAYADPASMHALTVLPLSLLPTLVVPLIIVTHLIMLVRLLRARAA